MSGIVNRLKSNIYYNMGLFFPSFFKKRNFSKLNKAFENVKNIGLLPEKELLVLNYLMKENSVAIDVGANNGLYCYFFKEIKKCKQVLAFEPLPNLYQKLKKWFSNVDLYNIALSNKKETTKIHIPIINNKLYESRAKLDDLKEENETHSKEIQINTDTLDNVVTNTGLKHIDIIKIDIEGHELKVIQGALNTIKIFKPYLLIEIESRHHNNSITEPVDFICKLNYSAFFFNFKTKHLEPFSQYNVVEMQNTKNQNTFNYINNFLFFPNEKMTEVETVNQQLLTYLKK